MIRLDRRHPRASKAVASVLALVLLVAGLGACGEAAPAEPLKLGLLTYISAGSHQNAQDRQRAFHLAVTHLNQAGGVFGRPVATAVGDTALNPDTAVAEARRLTEDEGVHALVGPSTSANALPVAEGVAGPARVPLISPSATSPTLTDAEDDDFFFRAALSDLAQGPVLARIARQRGFDNVGLIYRNDLWGQGLARAFEDAWDGSVRTVASEPGQTGFADALRETAAGGAQALIVILFQAEAIAAVREALDGGVYDRFVLGDALKNTELIEAIGADALAGTYGAGTAVPPDSRSSSAWMASWLDAYGEPPRGSYVREVYDATIALALAAQAANSTDGVAIRDRLRSIGVAPGQSVVAGPDGVAEALETLADGGEVFYQGASGTLAWNANGDLAQGHVGIWRFTADGRIEDVEAVPYPS
ncbi:MAG: ABC transporter substrate-binding protein [Chloroflexota bacterium]|nr:ABC transporter substrate-binding protein [Chloroflexota bacterium]MDE2918630.1 ABC transporter substrate-binding protein [Chloroflexota bacterium]